MQLGSMFIIAVTNKHTAKLHHIGSLYILTYDAWKIKHKIFHIYLFINSTPKSIYRSSSNGYRNKE
jgi:hypothetical protein